MLVLQDFEAKAGKYPAEDDDFDMFGEGPTKQNGGHSEEDIGISSDVDIARLGCICLWGQCLPNSQLRLLSDGCKTLQG